MQGRSTPRPRQCGVRPVSTRCGSRIRAVKRVSMVGVCFARSALMTADDFSDTGPGSLADMVARVASRLGWLAAVVFSLSACASQSAAYGGAGYAYSHGDRARAYVVHGAPDKIYRTRPPVSPQPYSRRPHTVNKGSWNIVVPRSYYHYGVVPRAPRHVRPGPSYKGGKRPTYRPGHPAYRPRHPSYRPGHPSYRQRHPAYRSRHPSHHSRQRSHASEARSPY